MVETLLGERPYSLLNTVSPTHLHLQTGTLTCVDLSIVSYPVLIEVSDRTYTQCPSKFIFDCADWSKYRKRAICDREAGSFPTGDTALEYFVSKLLESANFAIPQTKGSFRVKRVPCWNAQLSASVKEKKKAARRYHRTLLVCITGRYSVTELQEALRCCSNTASGEDEVYYAMIQNIPYETSSFLLTSL